MSAPASRLLREHVADHPVGRALVPFLALVAVVVGLLALHSLSGTGHSHAADTGASSSADHHHGAAAHHHAAESHGHASTAHQHDVPGAVPSIGPAGPAAAECPEGAGLQCCAAAVACVMVLALLSVSIAIGGGPAVIAGAVTLLALVAAFTLRVAPARPPSLAQLSTFRV